jgi:hypothetical protein
LRGESYVPDHLELLEALEAAELDAAAGIIRVLRDVGTVREPGCRSVRPFDFDWFVPERERQHLAISTGSSPGLQDARWWLKLVRSLWHFVLGGNADAFTREGFVEISGHERVLFAEAMNVGLAPFHPRIQVAARDEGPPRAMHGEAALWDVTGVFVVDLVSEVCRLTFNRALRGSAWDRPCASPDCEANNGRRADSLYCSKRCSDRERQRRHRAAGSGSR